jgi:hypothetical protein
VSSLSSKKTLVYRVFSFLKVDNYLMLRALTPSDLHTYKRHLQNGLPMTLFLGEQLIEHCEPSWA